jgi:diguanylate cyclase (GGDEF)-like protein/PAS domain S-box-containing protein
MTRPQNESSAKNVLSEEFYQTIFMQAGDGIFLIDEQGIMLEMNPRGCEILGYTRDELRGLPVMKLHPADAIDHIQKELGRLTAEKLVTTESVFIRKDGSRVPVEITGKLLSNNQIIGLLRDISERKKAEKVTQKLLSTDPLTGLYNRRYFFDIVNALISEATRYRHPITFMLLDLDHLKKVNDTHGHIKGDLALQHLANGIHYVTRASDIAARFGGDEFVIFLPQTDTAQAVYLAERLREHLSSTPVPHIEDNLFITLSIGMTSVPAPYESVSIDSLMEQADMALYQAKQSGRNRICVWTMSGGESFREDLFTIEQ